VNRLRVLLVARNYWPHGSHDLAAYLCRLAGGLHRRGVRVEILTPRYESSWPESLAYREIPIHRPAAAPRSEWSIGRYSRHLLGWLRDHGPAYDILLAGSMRDESAAVIEAARSIDRPSVVRHSGWGGSSDAVWWSASRGGRRCRAIAKAADRVIVATAGDQRMLLTEGFPADRVVRIENGFEPSGIASPSRKQAARRALASANGDLATSADTPVVLWIGRMDEASGVSRLAKCVRPLVSRHPDLRFWFVGDGPDRESMHALLKGDGVRASIAMPGSFVDLDDLTAAADLYVQTGRDGLDCFLPSAISAGLPAIIPDDSAARAALGTPSGSAADGLIRWFESGSTTSLRDALQSAVESLGTCQSEALELRRLLLRERPLSDTIDRYLRVLNEVRGQRSVTTDRSTGAAS
jgi:glycosyltransferase involved in cell wall biosynthesis